jgi:hypothetical protein
LDPAYKSTVLQITDANLYFFSSSFSHVSELQASSKCLMEPYTADEKKED